MLRTSRTLLAISVSAALCAPATQAEDQNSDSLQQMSPQDQCQQTKSGQKDINDEPIYIDADRAEAQADTQAVYEGNVVVTQGARKIEADTITHKPVEQVMIAEGDVRFRDSQVKANADKITAHLETEETRMENSSYQFLCESGRGEAAMVLKSGQKVYELEDGSLTSCPEGDNAWMLKAGSIEVDKNEEQAYFYHTRFEILDVPVFYVPYMSMPVGGKRKSGLLFPSVSLDTKDGLKIRAPIYWNLAPNYDLTTTINYMERRGTQFDANFRYLTEYGSGSLQGEYINRDEQSEREHHRWAFGYKHDGIIAENWKVNIDYSRVSDADYFKDLDSSVGNREDGQLLQMGSASYRQQNWDVELKVKDFQILDEGSTQPYQLLPQLKYNFYAPGFYSGVNFDLVSHISRFENIDKEKPTAARVHVEPGIQIPLTRPWGSLTGEARMLTTYYQQEFDDSVKGNEKLEEQVTRTLPEVRINGLLNLERDAGSYTQTLEPQVQYLYIPKVNQENIALYDTTLLQTDYYGLFRSRKYSGVDYINPANQISYGATTRFYDGDYKERLNISFGQIYYLQPESDNGTEDLTAYSAWAVESDFNFNDYLFYHGGIQYDVKTSAIQLGNSALEYRFDKGYVQGNYRYVSKDYISQYVGFIDQSDQVENKYTRDGISQAGLLTGMDLTRNWRAEIQYFHDLTENVKLESLAKLAYTSDCWFVAIAYTQQLRDWENGVGTPGTTPTYENNLKFNIGIRGFGTELSSIQSTDNALGYGRPFYLNN